MQLEGSAPATSPAVATRDALRLYFRGRGYRETKRPLELRRGSSLGTLIGLTPRKWAVVVQLANRGGTWSVTFDVNTTGHILTKLERRFWHDELEGALGIIEGRFTPDPASAERRAAKLATRALKLSILYSLGIGMVATAGAVVLELLGLTVGFALPAALAGVGAGLGLRKAVAEGNAPDGPAQLQGAQERRLLDGGSEPR